jgi:hypothetical protein
LTAPHTFLLGLVADGMRRLVTPNPCCDKLQVNALDEAP